MPEANVIIEEAQASDAPAIQELIKQLSNETDFITETESLISVPINRLAEQLEKLAESPKELCLLLKVDNHPVGLLNISNSHQADSDHIGELFIAIKAPFQGYGLGQDLLAIAIDWAIEIDFLKKIELEVQVENQKAIHIYEKFGFEIEGKRKLAVKTKDGEFRDVYLMGRILEN